MNNLPNTLNPETHAWLAVNAVRRIFALTREGGGEARIVGGAVRDALMGRPIGDIDFATTLPPEKTVKLLQDAKIKCVPTGIDHGTITAVIDGKGYEITTLRHDVETDGRRAKVAFIDDWQTDAARRDLTINALSLDENGKLHDFFGGSEDMAAGRVHFIGDAATRIEEDVLRIFRFFRFTAWFAIGEIDAEGLAACRQLAHLIPQLSVERIWRELVKLLAAPNPARVWALMISNSILKTMLPEANNLALFDSLLAIEKKHQAPPSSLRRLASLLPPDETTARAVAERLKLSKRDALQLQTLAKLSALIKGKLDPVPFRRAMYEHGAEPARDAALLLASSNPELDLDPAMVAAAVWEKPIFPLQGEDLLAAGLKPGPAIGALLKQIEEQWIASDFKATRKECLALLANADKPAT